MSYSNLSRAIPPHDRIDMYIEFDGCTNTEDEVNFMEHVYLQVTIDADNRGQLDINYYWVFSKVHPKQ